MLPATAEWHAVLNRTTWTWTRGRMERESQESQRNQDGGLACGANSGLRPMETPHPGAGLGIGISAGDTLPGQTVKPLERIS